MAVHHITSEMVKDRPAFKQSDLWYKLRALFDKWNNAIAAHNAQFDVAIDSDAVHKVMAPMS
jgi:DNA polymerase III epsilon subunit-like protein